MKQPVSLVLSSGGSKGLAQIGVINALEKNDFQISSVAGSSNISKLIAVGDKRSFGYYSLLKATTSAMVHKIAKQNIELSKPDILINIPYDYSDTFDFHKAEELIKLGETAANEAILNYLKS